MKDSVGLTLAVNGRETCVTKFYKFAALESDSCFNFECKIVVAEHYKQCSNRSTSAVI
jgi:hypothetical protein